jgi:hypothetical protein
MAKPTKYAPHICIICTIFAIIGIILGFVFSNPLLSILFLLPTAIYEAYRTEGKSTKASSYLLVIVLFAEIFLVAFNVDFNFAEFLGKESQLIGGYWVPLGDLKIVAPTLVAILSVILFVRTYGKFTKWLSVVIFFTSFTIIYLIDPVVFQELFRFGIQEALNRL